MGRLDTCCCDARPVVRRVVLHGEEGMRGVIHSRHTPSAWLLYDAMFMRRHDTGTGDLVSLLKVIQSDEDGEAS